LSLSASLKLLMALCRFGEINITRLAKVTGLRYDVLERNLAYLSQRNYVEIMQLGRSKVVRLNYSNPKVIIVKDLLEELSELF